MIGAIEQKDGASTGARSQYTIEFAPPRRGTGRINGQVRAKLVSA